MAHTVSLHTALMQKQCVAVCAMCASHLLVITVSPSIPWHVPGLATCSVFASPCPLMPRKPLKFSACFMSLPGPQLREVCRSLCVGSHTLPKSCLSLSMSLAFFHLDTVFPSVSIPVINSDPNFVRLTYVDQQRAQAFPKKSSLKLLVVFVFCREIL